MIPKENLLFTKSFKLEEARKIYILSSDNKHIRKYFSYNFCQILFVILSLIKGINWFLFPYLKTIYFDNLGGVEVNQFV